MTIREKETAVVRGPWWSATPNQKYVFGLALVEFPGRFTAPDALGGTDTTLQVYAFTEVTDEKPFTIEAAEDLQNRFEALLGKVIVEGHS